MAALLYRGKRRPHPAALTQGKKHMMETLIYRGQYEITDQEQTLSALAEEAGRRLQEDALRLGLVPNGPMAQPEMIELDGNPWLQVEIPVRDSANLLGLDAE